MTPPTFDLQCHSTRSDGALEPAQVVAGGAAAGVELLALTDHDSVDGVEEALQAAQEHGIALVPAAELSAVYEGEEDLHILGYGLDHRDPALRERLESFRADRIVRIDAMADRLRELGLAVDPAPLEARRAAGDAVGRPHLAAAAFNHPDNAERIEREGLVDASALLVAYLIPERPAYRPRTFPTVADAIEVIHDAGGVAVWAHPFWDVDSSPRVLEVIDHFAGLGLDGVEVFYVTHTREQTELLADHCSQRGLLQTGSADFHGPQHPQFNRFRAFELHGREPMLGPIAQSSS